MKNSNYIRRKADDFLAEWKNDPHRKPLIVKGARQVGKTFTVRKCLGDEKANYLEINLLESPEIVPLIEKSRSVDDFIINV